MKCGICGAGTKSGLTTVSIDNGTGVIVVRNVPANICERCGEEWIDSKNAMRVETITKRASKDNAQIEVVALAGV